MKQVKNFLMATGVWSLVMAVAILTQAVAHADESISKIALNVQQKEVLVNFMKGRIARHKTMRNSGEVIADLSQVVAKNREMVGKNGVDLASFDKGAGLAIDSIKAIGDKDVIMALETAQLQEVMQSDNLLFGFTRWNFSDCNMRNSYHYFGSIFSYGAPNDCKAVASIWLIFLVPLDLIAFPFELIASAVTGF
ncbi:hypothetical protein WDW37_15320 [Bdellovibrionota bacterium FG-1]